MKRLVLIALLLSMAGQGWGATYYMRADGTAANKGAASGGCGTVANCMSVTTHNSETFSAGDIIYFCDDGGDFTTTSLVIPSSGAAGNVITYKNAPGETPEINPVATYTTWVSHGGSIYQRAHGSAQFVHQVWEDGERLEYREHIADMDEAGTWAVDTTEPNVIHIWSTDSSDPDNHIIEYGDETIGVQLNGKSHLVFDGINVSRSDYAGYNTDVAGSHDVLIENCTVSWGGMFGIRLGSFDTGPVGSTDTITVKNVIAHDDFEAGIWVGYGTTMIVDGCVVYDEGKDVYPNGKLYPDNESGLFTAPKVHSSDGILMRNTTNSIVKNSYVHDIWDGRCFMSEYAAGEGGDNLQILYNHCVSTHNSTSRNQGILDEAENSIIAYNIVEVTYAKAFHARDNPMGATHPPVNPHIYNNTFYSAGGADVSIYLENGSDISIYNNIIYRNGGTTRYISVPSAGGAQVGFLADNNLYYGSASEKWFWGPNERTALSGATSWQTDLGGCPNAGNDCSAVNSDPSFVSAGTDFHLSSSSSPAVDQGDNVSLVSDYDGRTVPYDVAGTSNADNGADIGAYEWIPYTGLGIGLVGGALH